MRRPLAYTLLALALGTAACAEDEGSLSAEQASVLQSLTESAPAWTEESPGTEGATADAAAPLTEGLASAPGDTFQRPAFWGRFRRAHSPSRDRVVVIEGDTARVHVAIDFNGVFVVDSTHDGIRNPGHKPLLETARQEAVLVRDSTAPRGWRLAGLSIRRFQNNAPALRTVNITGVTVGRNSDAPLVVTDPETILPAGAFTAVSVGDTLSVVVTASNSTGTDLVPPTQMFIHVRHLQPEGDNWGRFPMHRQEDGSWKARWVVRRPGAALVAVDALDSMTLTTQSGDDYRSDLWAVPVRVQ